MKSEGIFVFDLFLVKLQFVISDDTKSRPDPRIDLRGSDAREAKAGIGLVSKTFVLLADEPAVSGQGLEKQATTIQLCFLFQ